MLLAVLGLDTHSLSSLFLANALDRESGDSAKGPAGLAQVANRGQGLNKMIQEICQEVLGINACFLLAG